MGKSLIQVVNQSAQNVLANSVIDPGSTQRRYGCDLRLSGNGIEIVGTGYYKIDGTVSIASTDAGDITVGAYLNGVQIPGAIAYTSGTAGNPVTIPIVSTIRRGCGCNGADNLTLVLIEGAGIVSNVSLRVEKS